MQSLDTIAMHKHIRIYAVFFFLMNFKVFLLVHNESLYIQKANAIESNSNFLVRIPYITSYQKKNGIINFFMLPYLNGAV